MGYTPNEIAISKRDNDQQNHWVQWGTNHFQTHPFIIYPLVMTNIAMEQPLLKKMSKKMVRGTNPYLRISMSKSENLGSPVGFPSSCLLAMTFSRAFRSAVRCSAAFHSWGRGLERVRRVIQCGPPQLEVGFKAPAVIRCYKCHTPKSYWSYNSRVLAKL